VPAHQVLLGGAPHQLELLVTRHLARRGSGEEGLTGVVRTAGEGQRVAERQGRELGERRRGKKGRVDKGRIDARAAALLLQSYLDARGPRVTRGPS